MQSPKSETLGASLAVLFGVAARDRAEEVVARTPQVPFGAPCVYPQIPDVPPYHNNGIWPFVQSFWNWAASKGMDMDGWVDMVPCALPCLALPCLALPASPS